MTINSWDEEFFSDEELENTPRRIEAYHDELAERRDYDKFTTFENPGYDQMIIQKDIEFFGLCAHHLLPFMGRAHVGYVPDEEIIGLSKLARAVDKFASKPQVQERLTQEVVDFLDELLDPEGVMVVMEADHLCMQCLGVGKQHSSTVTSAFEGVFEDQEPRMEFLKLVKDRNVLGMLI